MHRFSGCLCFFTKLNLFKLPAYLCLSLIRINLITWKLIQNICKTIKFRVPKILAYIITGFLTLGITFFLILQSPLSQTVLARMAASFLSSELKAEFNIKRLEINSWESITLNNLLAKDLHNDTIISTDELSVNLDFLRITISDIHVNSVLLKNADIRLRKYQSDSAFNFQFIVDYFIKKDKKVQQDNKTVYFNLQELEIINSRFIYEDQLKEPREAPINFADIEVDELNLLLEEINIIEDSLSIMVKQTALKEKSGFEVDSLACLFIISKGYMGAKNLKATTPKNKLDLDFSFSYNNMQDFQDFINNVKIETQIRPTMLNLSEVGFFAPVMFNMDNTIRVRADIKGTVSNFKANDFRFSIGESTQFMGEVRMNGLPDVRETFSNFNIDYFKTTIEDVRQFRLPTQTTYISLPEILTTLGDINIDGNFTGFYNDFVSYANFKTEVGQLKTDISLQVNSINRIAYNGHLNANDFNAGKFFNVEDIINKLDLVANVKGSGLSFENMEITMDGMVDSLELFNYVYNQIEINGDLIDQKFTGYLSILDDFINLDFLGSIDYGSHVPSYNFTANVKDAYLQQINLISRDDSSKLSTNMSVNLMGDTPDNMQGIAKFDSTTYSENDRVYFMDQFAVSFTRESQEYSIIRLFSDILDATVEGNYTFVDLPINVGLLLKKYMGNLQLDTTLFNKIPATQDFIFNIELKNTNPITELFVPDLKVSPGTRISGGYNSGINNLFFDVESDEIFIGEQKIKNWMFEFFIDDQFMQFITKADRVYISDTLYTDSLSIHALAKNDTINYIIDWDKNNKTSWTNGDVKGNIVLFGNNRYGISFENADIALGNKEWQIIPENNIFIDTNFIQFENVGLKRENQYTQLHGTISHDPADTLLLEFRDFDISNSDFFFKNLSLNLDGLLNGSLKIVDYYESPFYLGDISITDFYYNKEKLGTFNFKSLWDPKLEAFDINGNIIYIGNTSHIETLNIGGQYFPSRNDQNFNIDIALNKYKLTTLEPFTQTFSSDIEGMASGSLKLTGSRSKPVLTGEMDINRGAMLINYLNVKYYFADKIKFNDGAIYFDQIVVNDSLNNIAYLSGGFTHDHLTNFSLDLNVTTNEILGMNTSRKLNNVYYGQAFASGNVRIHGPIDNLTMDIGLRSERGTNIKIPISYDTEVGNNEFIVFLNNEEEEKKKYRGPPQAQSTGVSLGIELDITNDAQIQMFMPYNMGNIRTRGHGNMRMNYLNTGAFSMEGEYNIDRGSFFFTLQNVINRDFDIRRGSKVSWSGDPYDARINMIAVYKVKTTLGDFGPPEDSTARVPVDCIISLRNSLLDPEIKFTVEFPDLREDTKQYIYSRLDTNDQAMMSQQMMSLLILNSFSSNSGYAGSVGFNTFSLLTNQLSNWLSNISNDFDIGVNYRPGDQVTAQEVEVALSTQLWDDRVLIDGNVGVRGSETTQNTNSIVGEVTVEYKITPEGNIRAKAFNKSNNNELYKNNYAPYTQGVGIFYTKEFDKFREAFNFRRKKDNYRSKEK